MKKTVLIASLLIGIAGAGAFDVTTAPAADCDALLLEIKGERRLLKRRKILAAAIKECPAHAETNFQYGYILERLREYENALAYYKNAVRLNSSSAKYFFGMGDVYKVLGKQEAAVDAYEKGLLLDPENERARITLASLREVTEPETVPEPPVAPTKPEAEKKKPLEPERPEPLKTVSIAEKKDEATPAPPPADEEIVRVEEEKKAEKPEKKDEKIVKPIVQAKVDQPTPVIRPDTPLKVRPPKNDEQPQPKSAPAKKAAVTPPEKGGAEQIETARKIAEAKAGGAPEIATSKQKVLIARVTQDTPLRFQKPIMKGHAFFVQRTDDGLGKFGNFFKEQEKKHPRFRKMEAPGKAGQEQERQLVAKRRVENEKNEAIDALKIDPGLAVIVYYGPDRKIVSKK